MTPRTLQIVTLGLGGLLAAPALADSIGPGDTEIELELTSLGPNRAVLAYFNDGSTVYNRVVSAGTLNWTGGLTSFCVQLLEGATVGQTRTFDVVDLEDVPEAPPGPGPMGAARATLIRDLFARHYDSLLTATGSDQNDMNAAFATVVWEITHQDSDGTTAAEILADLDISNGNARFSSGSAVTGLAIDWLNSLGGGTDDFLWFNGLVGLSDPTTQDFITVVVPGPAGVFAGLGLFGMRRRRR